MTASNHVVTGALIGAIVPVPVVAIPLALASHLVLDASPHFGSKNMTLTDTKFMAILGTDIFVSLMILSAVYIARPTNWILMLVCAVVSASPDLVWLPYWIKELRGKNFKRSRLAHFLGWIQWGERPWGWLVEIGYFVAIIYFLISYLMV